MVSSSHRPAAGGRRRASLSLLRFWKAGVLPRRPASGPGGARRRRLRARRKPAPLPLEARPGLPALLAAPGWAQGGQALLLRAPPAGRAERLAGRRAACAYVLLRNSFSGKWGSFAQQRPLALSSVRRLQPPCNVTVRHQDALAYLRALPCLAHQCIYADPPYIFPGRSMNYYGTRGGHDLVFHMELRNALRKRPALRPKRQRRTRGQGALQRGRLHYKLVLGQEQFQARAARSAPGQSCCHSRIGWSNPVATAGLTMAILLPQQD